MRQRKIKNLEEKLNGFSAYWTREPEQYKGMWRSFIGGEGAASSALYVEIGCGKGQFITRQAVASPDALWLAFEGHESVVLHALEKTDAAGLTNVRFVLNYLNDLSEIFEDGEIDGIYLNFSDPWPKDRHAKRRLTYGKRLAEYSRALKPGGFLEFRTDNDELFAYSLDEFAAQSELKTDMVTLDLHSAVDKESLITTEYEDKFAAGGKPIHFLRVRKAEKTVENE